MKKTPRNRESVSLLSRHVVVDGVDMGLMIVRRTEDGQVTLHRFVREEEGVRYVDHAIAVNTKLNVIE